MKLAYQFKRVVSELPDNWTDVEFDLQIEDKEQYIDAALLLTQCNAQPYNEGEWHWRLLIANKFGHAASVDTVMGVFEQLDRCEIAGELRFEELREGRAEIVQMWGRPESVRQEFRQRRAF